MTAAAADGSGGGGGDGMGMPRVFLVIFVEGPFATFFEPFRDPVAAVVGGNGDIIYIIYAKLGVNFERCLVK